MGKQLRGKGEVNYDYKHDILFFKTSEREYLKSIELDNVVLDLDKEDFLVGIQIFEASKFLKIKKKDLLLIPFWEYSASINPIENGARIDFRLTFQIKIRNKIIEKNPIILENIRENLPSSKLVCVATA